MGFSDMMKGTSAGKAMRGEGNKSEIVLNKICLRESNKYTFDFKEFESLKNSIKELGLFSPITVNEIDNFLNLVRTEYKFNSTTYTFGSKLPDDVKDAYDFYSKKKNEGFDYFITTGHRRFKAYCSLAIGEDVKTMDDVNAFYSKFDKVLAEEKAKLDAGDFTHRNKFCSIKCFIVNDSIQSERDRYNSANIHQRATKEYEIIINMIDDIKARGLWNEFIEQNKAKRIDSMTDRAAFDTLKRLNLYKNNIKSGDDAKSILRNVSAEDLPGFKADLNNSIADYIEANSGKHYTAANINIVRQLVDKIDGRIIDLVFDGHLDYKKMREMDVYYDKLVKDYSVEDICKMIKNGEFDHKAMKAKYSSKKPKPKKIGLSDRDWIKLFTDLHDGKITIDDAYGKLKSLNLVK